MKYKKIPLNEKRNVVEMVVNDHLSIAEAGRKTGLATSTIRAWLRNPETNQDAEYVRMLTERKRSEKVRGPGDPLPEGVAVASRTDPDELERENRDLRRKVAYLEDKVGYLETLYSIIGEDPAEVPKKKDSKPSSGSSGRDGQT